MTNSADHTLSFTVISGDAGSSIRVRDEIRRVNDTTGERNEAAHALCFIRRGTKRIQTPHDSWNIGPGQFILIPQGLAARSDINCVDDLYESTTVLFSTQNLNRVLNKHDYSLLRVDPDALIYTGDYDLFIKFWIEGARVLNSKPSRVSARVMEAKFEELLVYLLDKPKIRSAFLQLAARSDGYNKAFKEIIERNVLVNRTLKELSEMCNMSISSFRRKFKLVYGSPPISWINRRKMEYAAHKLMNRDVRVTEVYLEIGFQSGSAFSQAFKRQFGVSPREYRSQRLSKLLIGE